MPNHCCINIGINQYQFFQPLSYAVSDAQELQKFLVKEAGWSNDSCLLLTDTSGLIQEIPTIPTKNNIMTWMERIQKSATSEDIFWFYFSGYAITHGGEDYLVTSEGNLDNLSNTAISVSTLYAQLKKLPTSSILVLLDFNRSSGLPEEDQVGKKTMAIAQEYAIPTIISAAPEEYSQEANTLGHGLFTVALLEALRYYQSLSLEGLDRYLKERIPELCQHHWRPLQTPVTIIPTSALGQQIVFTLNESIIEEWEESNNPWVGNSTHLQEVGEQDSNWSNVSTITTNPSMDSSYDMNQNGKQSPPSVPVSPIAPIPEEDNNSMNNQPEGTPSNSLLWGSLVLLVGTMIAAVILRNPQAFMGRAPEEVNPNTATTKTPIAPNATATKPTTPAVTPKPTATAQPTAAVTPKPTTTAAVVTPKPPATAQPTTAAVVTPKPPTPTAQPTAAVVTPKPPATAQPTAAITPKPPATAQPTAAVTPKPIPTTTVAVNPTTTKPNPVVNNADKLDKARVLLAQNQASVFRQAIAQAQTIPPQDPAYAQAQEDIKRWSNVILDMAKGRAQAGQYQQAVKTAQLIPATPPEINTQAQQYIKTWQTSANQQKQNNVILNQAKGKIKRFQASSYHQAIKEASKIAKGQPLHGESQNLINQWNQQIYAIAQSRAARKDFKGAIAAAQLITPGSNSWTAAQKAIATWKKP